VNDGPTQWLSVLNGGFVLGGFELLADLIARETTAKQPVQPEATDAREQQSGLCFATWTAHTQSWGRWSRAILRSHLFKVITNRTEADRRRYCWASIAGRV